MGDWIRPRKIIMERFRQIFTGLERAHGCTYVDKKGADGLKVKGKSFVKREMRNDSEAPPQYYTYDEDDLTDINSDGVKDVELEKDDVAVAHRIRLALLSVLTGRLDLVLVTERL